ncbi:hypothetical protein D4764_0188240 [Takifugu flavidus]|uniref:CCHC-type domain-containing protein n=1 Tax=Takifugu flavidus TaxID=433684 RepID=A0A5C6MLM8_9TELE|nr:hypothetical protein D4764_0188240 [Takifugu flavidus]
MAANANLTGLSRRHGVKSAARMNRAVVLFVEKVEQANRLVETGITVGGQFVQVTPLMQPAARITLSNVPPFISDEFLRENCPDMGNWQVHMILNNRAEEFNYSFVVRVDDFDYVLFATSSALKCFNCGEEGHLARACPNRAVPDAVAAEPAAPAEPPAPRPVPAARRRRCGAEGDLAAPDGAEMEPKAEGTRSECVRVTEVSGARRMWRWWWR